MKKIMAMILGVMLLASFPLVLAHEEDCYDTNGDGNFDPLDIGYVLARIGSQDEADMSNLDFDNDGDIDGRDADLVENGLSDPNGDGDLNPLDYGYILARYGSTDPDDLSADLNGNGIVGWRDLRRAKVAVNLCGRQ